MRSISPPSRGTGTSQTSQDVALHACHALAIVTVAPVPGTPGSRGGSRLNRELKQHKVEGKRWEKPPMARLHSPLPEGDFWGCGGWGDLSDSPLCPFRRALCCVLVAVPCWPSAPCWPSWLSCCPAEPASADSAPWLATCRQQQASDDGALLFGVERWGVLWWHRGACKA